MTRPLKIQSTTPISLKEMSDSDLDYMAHQILTEFASANTGTGTLSVNPVSNSGLTLIGTFSDTYRPYSIGDHPVGTEITTVDYNFYQDLQTLSTSPTRPIKFVSGQGLKEQEDTDIQTHEITRTLSRLVDNGLGSYRLQPTSPTVGGTWAQMAAIQNTYGGTSSTTYLWRRTDQTAPSTVRPLKTQATSPVSLKEMSDTEIKSLTSIFRNYIVSSGIGKYAVQSSAPSPGTWVQMGTAFSDTRQQVGNQTYTTNFTGFYGSSYTGFYAPTFSGTYTGYYSSNFSGTYSSSFSGTYTGTAYAGTNSSSYTGYYARAYSGTYSTFYSGSYTSNYTGFYSRSFSGSYSRAFSGSYTGFYTGAFAGAYARFYGGYLNGYYTGAGAYARFYGGYLNGYYTGFYSSNFTGYYTGYYTGFFTGSYVGSFSGTYSSSYTGFYSRTFTGYYTTNYAGTYTSNYTGYYANQYTGSYTGNFTGSYTGNFTGYYTENYTGLTSYSGTYGGGTYSGTYIGYYTGLTVLPTTETVSTVSLWIRTA